MYPDFWEVHEAEYLAEQEYREWLAFEADLAESDPWAEEA